MTTNDEIFANWQQFDAEFRLLEVKHQGYLEKLSEVDLLQKECLNTVKEQQGRVRKLREILKTKLKSLKLDPKNYEKTAQIRDLETEISETNRKLEDMKNQLPVENNGIYLSIIMGSNLNLSLMNKNDRYLYKEGYEKFKLTITYITLLGVFLTFIIQTRTMDAICYFFMVWSYCTLTIRESILRINGSRIKGWWVTHHYASCVLCGIILTWKDGECYQAFRPQFLVFTLYVALVQIMQCQYQRGCLRRLYSLGQRHSMDVTVEGFSSWMFKGLTFLLPFLIAGYIFQFYNVFTLVQIWHYYDCGDQWQVITLALFFLGIAFGNSVTTLQVTLRKVREKSKLTSRRHYETKYSTSDYCRDVCKSE